MASPIVKAADLLGEAVGTYQLSRVKARYGKRPGFLGSWAESGRWQAASGTERQAQRRAATSSWVYTAITFIAGEVSAATFQVVEHKGVDEQPVQIPNHPLEVLLRRPNPWMGRAFLWQYTTWWLQLNGNAYWFVAAGYDGKPAEIWPLPAQDVAPQPGDEEQFIELYKYTVGGQQYEIPATNVVHFRLPNPFDIFRGLSPLTAAILGVDTDLAMARWNARFFGRDNVMPSAIINLSSGDQGIPIDESDVETLKEDLRTDYQAHKRKTAVTSVAKLEVELLGWSPKDLDFIQGRQYTKEEIYEIYGLPGGLLDKNATYANSANAEMIFNNKTLWPLLGLMAEQLTAELVIPNYGDRYEAAFEDVRRTNREQELSEIAAANPYLTIDEVRQRYWKLDPLADDRGVQTALEAQAPPAVEEFPATGGFETSGTSSFSPLAGGNGRGGASGESEGVGETAAYRARLATEDLRRWRTKALSAVKRGKPLPLAFGSDVIPRETQRAVIERLALLEVSKQVKGEARSSEAVRAVFEEVLPSPFELKAPQGRVKRPWDVWERRLYRHTLATLRGEGRRLTALLRERGENALHDEEFWNEHRRGLLEALLPGFLGLAGLGVQHGRRRLTAPMAELLDWDLVNQNAADWARQHAATLVTNVTETTRQQLRDDVADWVEAGEALPGLVRRVATRLDNPARAQAIAVTEATSTYATANDLAWTAAGVASAVYKPPAHVNCLLPGNVVAVPGLIAGIKSFYVGRAIEIRTERGRSITVTENHPVLTEQGWRAAHLIEEGDQVLVCTDPQRVASSVYPDYNHVPTAVEEVFSALEVSGLVAFRRMPVTAKDLNGDARFIQGDVEIVYPDRLLLDDVEARLTELIRQYGLSRDDASAVPLASRSTFTTLFPRDDASPGGSVRGSALGSALGRGHPRPFEGFGFRAGARHDASGQEPLAESAPIDTGHAREFVFRFASDIAAEQVVQVRNFNVSTHVYDLQSELYQLYTANGVIVKNCRCYLQPVRLPDETWGVKWFTVRDSRVCVQPLKVPWQSRPVKGCKALHGVVVSEGKYLGKRVR